MNQKDVLQILAKDNAIITNSHIVYTSGRHGRAYVNKDAIYPHTEATAQLCHALADNFLDDCVDVVIAPAIGGVILSQWTARYLSSRLCMEVLSVYAENSPDGESFIIKRGYDRLLADKNVLVVEDVLTTGGSVKKVVAATRACGGNVIGVGALCNRGGVTVEALGSPRLESLVNISLESWDEDLCPLCQANVPINTDVGKGREFLARKRSEVIG